MLRHWKLEDSAWSSFDASAVEPRLLAAVKTASVVEANSADYVRYLQNVFRDDAGFKDEALRWGGPGSSAGYSGR